MVKPAQSHRERVSQSTDRRTRGSRRIINTLPLALMLSANLATAAPVIYTNEGAFQTALAALNHRVVHESFENDTVWAPSRNSIVAPGNAPSVASQGIVWTSNYPQNNIATGDVGGSAPAGMFAIYSLPHGFTTDSGLYCDSAEDPNIPEECYQNDGLAVESEDGEALYGFGGKIDTANSGKVTFLLDGVDVNAESPDNIDNHQREGDFADNWSFVGVIDESGFLRAELRELRGKDFQQVLLFADDFTLATAVPLPPAAGLFVAGLALLGSRKRSGVEAAAQTNARTRPG